jgi:hypothetical protein
MRSRVVGHNNPALMEQDSNNPQEPMAKLLMQVALIM